jgi:hypothetical protein
MITVDDLATAIESGIRGEERRLEYDEAFDLAQHVLNFFGYSNRIIDNVLEPEDRDTFYMLEDAGILTTEREEITLYDGREWRIHYWLFRREKIGGIIEESASESSGDDDGYGDIYKQIPDDAWGSRSKE